MSREPTPAVPVDIMVLADRLERCGPETVRAVDELLTAFEAGADPMPILVRWVGDEMASQMMQHLAGWQPMSVGAYVMGLEVFGFTFSVGEVSGKPHYFMATPDEPLPPGANAVVCELREAFGPGRADEVIAFLRERDGETGAAA